MHTVAPDIADYRILRPLGSGANGIVYLAEAREDQRLVALKYFRRDRLDRHEPLREVSTALSLRHPHLVPVEDFAYLENGDFFLAYRYMKSGTLRGYLQQHAKWSGPDCARMLQQLLQVLDYLHQQDIVHCDIKPENIYLEYPPGPKLSIRLGDLGVAQTGKDARMRDVAGSPAYMAPERYYDRFGPPSDLYSVGILAYELLTGHLPFSGGPRELAQAHIRQPIDWKDFPQEHSQWPDLLAGLLAKEPQDRPSSAQAALTRLEQLYPQQILKPTSRRFNPLPPYHSRAPFAKQTWPQERKIGRRYSQIFLWKSDELAELTVVYPSHLEIHHLSSERRPLRILIDSDREVRQLANGQLLYATASRFCLRKPGQEAVTTLMENPGRAFALALSSDERYIAWSERRRICHYDRISRNLWSQPHNNYGFTTQLKLWNDGTLAVTSGPLHPHITFYNAQGCLLQAHALPGPVLDQSPGEAPWVLLCMHPEKKGWVEIQIENPDKLKQRNHLAPAQPAWCLQSGVLSYLGHEEKLCRVPWNHDPVCTTQISPGAEGLRLDPQGGLLALLYESGNDTIVYTQSLSDPL